jgi:hypothetical protein
VQIELGSCLQRKIYSAYHIVLIVLIVYKLTIKQTCQCVYIYVQCLSEHYTLIFVVCVELQGITSRFTTGPCKLVLRVGGVALQIRL